MENFFTQKYFDMAKKDQMYLMALEDLMNNKYSYYANKYFGQKIPNDFLIRDGSLSPLVEDLFNNGNLYFKNKLSKFKGLKSIFNQNGVNNDAILAQIDTDNELDFLLNPEFHDLKRAKLANDLSGFETSKVIQARIEAIEKRLKEVNPNNDKFIKNDTILSQLSRELYLDVNLNKDLPNKELSIKAAKILSSLSSEARIDVDSFFTKSDLSLDFENVKVDLLPQKMENYDNRNDGAVKTLLNFPSSDFTLDSAFVESSFLKKNLYAPYPMLDLLENLDKEINATGNFHLYARKAMQYFSHLSEIIQSNKTLMSLSSDGENSDLEDATSAWHNFPEEFIQKYKDEILKNPALFLETVNQSLLNNKNKNLVEIWNEAITKNLNGGVLFYLDDTLSKLVNKNEALGSFYNLLEDFRVQSEKCVENVKEFEKFYEKYPSFAMDLVKKNKLWFNLSEIKLKDSNALFIAKVSKDVVGDKFNSQLLDYLTNIGKGEVKTDLKKRAFVEALFETKTVINLKDKKIIEQVQSLGEDLIELYAMSSDVGNLSLKPEEKAPLANWCGNDNSLLFKKIFKEYVLKFENPELSLKAIKMLKKTRFFALNDIDLYFKKDSFDYIFHPDILNMSHINLAVSINNVNDVKAINRKFENIIKDNHTDLSLISKDKFKYVDFLCPNKNAIEIAENYIKSGGTNIRPFLRYEDFKNGGVKKTLDLLKDSLEVSPRTFVSLANAVQFAAARGRFNPSDALGFKVYGVSDNSNFKSMLNMDFPAENVSKVIKELLNNPLSGLKKNTFFEYMQTGKGVEKDPLFNVNNTVSYISEFNLKNMFHKAEIGLFPEESKEYLDDLSKSLNVLNPSENLNGETISHLLTLKKDDLSEVLFNQNKNGFSKGFIDLTTEVLKVLDDDNNIETDPIAIYEIINTSVASCSDGLVNFNVKEAFNELERTIKTMVAIGNKVKKHYSKNDEDVAFKM